MRKVVIESPLSGDFERNRRYALWCGYHCYTLGEAAYASHLIYPQFLDDQNLDHRKFGIEAGYEWAAEASVYAFYLDLGESNGMKMARERWGKRIQEQALTKVDFFRLACIEERRLPPEMFAAFERGDLPGKTAGF